MVAIVYVLVNFAVDGALPRARPEDPWCSNRLTRRRHGDRRRRHRRSTSRRTRSSRSARSACSRGSASAGSRSSCSSRSWRRCCRSSRRSSATTCTPRPGIFSPGHILGSDDSGRDVLSRVIWGARASLLIAVGSVVFGTLDRRIPRPARRLQGRHAPTRSSAPSSTSSWPSRSWCSRSPSSRCSRRSGRRAARRRASGRIASSS